MRLLQFFKSKKYLQRILVSISLLIVVILCIFSAVLYYTSQKAVLHTQREANNKILAQINYNITTMKETVHSMANSLFWDPELIALMANRDLIVFDLLQKLRKLDTTVSTASFLDSILVYNKYSGDMYSGGNMTFRNSENPASITMKTNLLAGRLSKMKLTPVVYTDSSTKLDVFSYLFYDSAEGEYAGDSALILNVKPDWLFKNIKLINELALDSESQVYLVAGDGNILYSDSLMKTKDTEVAGFLRTHMKELVQDTGTFRSEIGGVVNLISYAKTNITDLYVVTIQPYSKVLAYVYKMRTTTIWMTLAFLLTALFLSMWIAHKLYRPIESLMKLVKLGPLPDTAISAAEKDELTFVSNMYKQMSESLFRVKEEQRGKQEILKNYYLRKLIADSSSISEEELVSMRSMHGLVPSDNAEFVIVLLTIDGYRGKSAPNHEPEIRLFQFAILNIAEEIVSRKYRCSAVDMKNQNLVLLVSSPDTISNTGPLEALLSEAQDVVKSYYKITFGAAISSPIRSYQDITRHYLLAQQHSQYHLVFGRKSIVVPHLLQSNLENKAFHFPQEIERRLSEAFKAGDTAMFSEALDRSIEHISKLHYDFILYSISHMAVIIRAALHEVNSNRVQPVTADINSVTQRAFEAASLEEVKEIFMKLLDEVKESQKLVKEERSDLLVETIKEYINQNYMDGGLNLQGISGMLKMSADYVGRIFKKSETISVADYINEVRLYHAQQLLENKSYSINEIMEKVGYSNQSSFFKIFKKKFGATPREYRLKKSLE